MRYDQLSILLFVLIFIFGCSKEQGGHSSLPLGIPKLKIEANSPITIGVVGSGIAGTSFVHQILQSAANNVDITVYEKEGRLAGRVKKDSLGGGLIEQGATLIHSSNHYLQEILDAYNLSKSIPHGGEGEAETLAIWDGQDFRLNTSRNSFRSSMQMLWAYGMSISNLSDLIKSIIPKWSQVYTKLGEGSSYNSPKDLFVDLGLYELTQQTSYQYFKDQGIDDQLVYEFVDCISRVNYHQDGNINAFTDAVSLAGAGLDGGTLFSVGGGNDKMIHAVLKGKSNINLLMNEEVTSITTLNILGDVAYEVRTPNRIDTLDIVVIACPLDLTNINIPGYSIKTDRAYQTVHAHFIAGSIDYTYFNDVSNNPQTIFTIEGNDIPFVSIAKTSFAPDWDAPIYKVFSRNKLDDAFFSKVFRDVQGSAHQEWKAYTVLSPMKEWPPFKINEGLYYINAMESAVSAMETQAVAARNVANLCIEHIERTFGHKNQ